MSVLLDASLIVAAADTADLNHAAAVGWLDRVDEPLLVTAVTLADADMLLQRELGPEASRALLETVIDGGLMLVPPTDADIERAAELMAEASEHRPRLSDALLAAAAERLGVSRVATFDRRPLAILRPRHVRSFDLEP